MRSIRSFKEIKFPAEPTLRNIRSLISILIHPECCLRKLDLSQIRKIKLNELVAIIRAISRNKTLIELNFECILWNYPNIDPTILERREDLIKLFARAIKFHPCLESLNVAYNDADLSVVVHSIPKTLKHLDMNSYFLPNDDLERLIRKNQLMTLKVRWRSDRIIRSSRSLIDVYRGEHRCGDYDYDYDYESSEEDDDSENSEDREDRIVCGRYYESMIVEVLKANRRAKVRSTKAALCLIAVRIYRKGECGLLGWVPKELVTYIARHITSSYAESVWRIPK